MSEKKIVRLGWLRGMYIWTIVVAGLFGLLMIFAPEMVKSMYGESCDPLPYGMLGSVVLAFGLMAILGLRAPVKFVPVLFMQLTYMVIWFIGVVLPFLIAGRATPGIPTVVIFALTIVGDLIAIPFSHVLAKGSGA